MLKEEGIVLILSVCLSVSVGKLNNYISEIDVTWRRMLKISWKDKLANISVQT